MGFSLGEILLLVIVGIIVVGPKRLPGMMRTAGQWVARLRRMSMDLRSQSGIDDLLRQEGLDQHIHELRSLARLNVVDTLMAPGAAPVIPTGSHPGPLDTPASKFDRPKLRPFTHRVDEPLREREYPLAGCDAYGALPDDASVYIPPKEPAAEPAGSPVEAAPAPDAGENAHAAISPETAPADAPPTTDAPAAPATTAPAAPATDAPPAADAPATADAPPAATSGAQP